MSAERELDAAGVTAPALREAYRRCRALNAEHGRTYYLATKLLSAEQRPAVHALYGFARWVDDIVDNVHSGLDEKITAIDGIDARLNAALTSGTTDDPVLAALLDTVHRYDIPAVHFHDFMASMRMDLTVTDYPTYADLERYVHGSAAVIGLQVLPVLGTSAPREEAEPAAAALGIAFQLTNFIRDVGEDLDRGRVYLPADELAAFGVDRERLLHARASGRADDKVRAALRDQVRRAREVYTRAWPGIAMLAPRSRPCVMTAYRLYGRILNLVEDADCDVLSRRVVVSNGRRLAVALPALARAVLARTA
ncbi:phytoene/squalene synthase family protein [Lentzea aerocolonigenes]|uniref:phytoene/squalene synthase family protein n=1 Tax=Lentzea aerocolonigenes TaxID=68170 RepID=UPI0004C4119F|nr:phytoene/squalene synthase family protein [Lentzea aerocolonigenes]MCP2246555.1 phytoene synthase (EC 2.5.1.32) [Lentzea aerocolonigenes]